MKRVWDPVANATDLIIKYHGDQRRKAGGKPTIVHLLEVSNLIRKGFSEVMTPELIAAGLCHDLLEDTPCTEKEILEACGNNVLQIVQTVSNNQNLSWEKKKKDYIRRVSKGGRGAQIVCLCDKIANMQSLLEVYKVQKENIWQNFNRGREKKIWFEEACYEMLERALGPDRYVRLYGKMIKVLENPYAVGFFDDPYIEFKRDIPGEDGERPDHYEIWLKNSKTKAYNVEMESGGFISCDEDYITIESKGIFSVGSVAARRKILLERGYIYGISDSIVWFRVWLSGDEGKEKVILFSVSKGFFDSGRMRVLSI